MIVKSAYGPVASWSFLDRSKRIQAHNRAALDERNERCQEIATILEEHELLHPRNIILSGWVQRDPTTAQERSAVVSVAKAVEIGPRCVKVLDDLEKKRGFRDFTNVMVVGTGTMLDVGGCPREVSDLIWLDAHTIQFHCVQLFTQSDIWLPFTLRGKPQAEIATLNASRLERALRAVCSRTKLSFGFEEISEFALNYGFRLDNRKNQLGAPLDVIDNPGMLDE